MRRERREATLRGWLEKLPEELFATRPVLSMDYVGALMSTGEIEGVEARLQDVERSDSTHPMTRSTSTRRSSAAFRRWSPCTGRDSP